MMALPPKDTRVYKIANGKRVKIPGPEVCEQINPITCRQIGADGKPMPGAGLRYLLPFSGPKYRYVTFVANGGDVRYHTGDGWPHDTIARFLKEANQQNAD